MRALAVDNRMTRAAHRPTLRTVSQYLTLADAAAELGAKQAVVAEQLKSGAVPDAVYAPSKGWLVPREHIDLLREALTS